ncbi:MAG: GyrI-like domain-containing protein [Bacteroidia bacterium]|nr:GyrI-like domain-containing protein [Bacteroidia bacterium]
MKKILIVLPLFFVFIFFPGCGEDSPPTREEAKTVEVTPITDTTSFSNNITVYNSKPGVLGIFNVPEMLVLSVMDSASLGKVAARMGRDFDWIQEDITYLEAEVNGPAGTINYNNKPENFKFETIVCIKRIPSKQPKRSKIVVLEAGPMLVFNFYGSQQNLFSAYDKIKRYCQENKLLASGPMREFYMTDSGTEPNPEKWLTRIMLPVMPYPED